MRKERQSEEDTTPFPRRRDRLLPFFGEMTNFTEKIRHSRREFTKDSQNSR